LRDALAAARFNEIQVEPGVTRFNSAEHEPSGMTVSRAGLAQNTVVHLERRGYTFEGKVVRPARVTLSAN
jgi:molecular chaperone GrpE (heat shock protein)